MQSRLRWLFFFITILSIASMAARVPLDTDMWWHIRTGEVSLSTHQPLVMDTFSYTRAGQPWVNHSWLAQILLAFLYQKLSFYGLTLYIVVLSMLTIGLLFFLLEGHPFIKAMLIIFGSAVVSTIWSPRPQLFTLLFLCLLVFVVTRYREGKVRWVWWIPLLFTLWGNLHGGYFTGILFLGSTLLGMLYDRIFDSSSVETFKEKFLHLLTVTLLSIPALLINPNGIQILKVPFATVGVNILRNFIDEWASPDFHQPLQLLFLAIFLGTMFLLAVNQNRKSAAVLIPLFGFSLLAFYAKRNIAPLMIVLLPVLAAELNAWLSGLSISNQLSDLLVKPEYYWKMRDENPLPMRIVNLLLIFIIGLVALGKFVYVSHPVVVNAYLKQDTPVEAYQKMGSLDFTGNVLNEYGWGGYQIEFYPQNPVFVDGRTDLFGDDGIGQWMQLMRADGDFEKILDRYKINVVLLKPERMLVQALKTMGWTEEYADQTAVLLLRPAQ
jgi:hypothetical protein